MKKTIITLVALLTTVLAGAQQKWDFSNTNAADVEALKAATSEWTYDEANNRYTNVNEVNGTVTAGGQELVTTKGLKVLNAAATKLKIDVDKRLQLGGKNISILIPGLKKGQEVSITFASTGATAVTFDNLGNLTDATGFAAADKNTTQEGKAVVASDGDVTLASTGGSINVFTISVSNAGEEPADDTPQTTDHSVAKSTKVNQALLQFASGTIKYYNTSDLASIDVDDATVTVNTLSQAQDVFNGTVTDISFAKKADDGGKPGDLNNNGVELITAQGWLESLYVTWHLYEGATSYVVYVKGGRFADYTKIDDQLVRNYGTYGRADVVGLTASGDYAVKVVPVVGGNELAAEASEATNISVAAYNRGGFAHLNYAGVGAYNNDGSLKQGARVIYVTAKTAKTVKCSVTTSTKNGPEEYTGLQAIIDAYQKGLDKTPLAVRLIGLINADDMDSFSSSAEGLQIKGKNADSELNITIEGIGEDATVYGFGFLVRNAKSVEFRNFAIMQCMDDGISMDTDNSNIWVHHVDVFYGRNKGGDQKKGDGAIDVKSDSKYVTIDNCHFWDTGKSSMCGMKSESGPNYITYHHNWFDHSDSRHARVRTMSVHMYNNYFDQVAKYGVGATTGSSVFVENNYFLGTKKPILSSLQGTDAQGSGTFSGEDGGMIKAFGNYFDRAAKNFKYYTQKNAASTGYDAYETDSRDELVPETEVTKVGGTRYNNFDTNTSLMYKYDVDAAEDVPAQVTGYYGAGRMNHGDFEYTFKDNVGDDNTDSEIDTALEAKIKAYKSTLVGIFGDENAQSGEQGNDDNTGNDDGKGDNTGGDDTPEGTILASFDGAPSHSFFTIGGSYGDGKATYEGTYYKKGVKLDSKGSITFTPTKDYSMVLILGTAKPARDVKLNGELTTVTGTENAEGAYYELEPIAITKDTEYVITKGSAEGLVMLIKLIPVE